MNQVIQDKFIPQQLLYFLAGRRCCQQFACTYRPSEHEAFVAHSRAYGLRSQIVYNNGQNCVKVFKQACRHYMEQPKNLSLSSASIMNMFTLLSRTALLGKEDVELYTDLGRERPTWRTMHLPLPSIRPQTAYFKTEGQRIFLQSFPGHLHYDEILKLIYANRVIVFDADRSWDKSVFLPLLILDDCGNKKSNVKIICIEKDSVVAVHNSQRMAAKYFGEEVGETVGIQLPHSSMIGSKTHIIFSTAQYFLRAVANQKFHNISHLVVNDVHLHDPYTDLLLSELRDALNSRPNLRVVLLSQTGDLKKFTAFFGEGAEVNMKRQQPSRTRVSHLDDIHSSIALAGIHKGPDIYKEIPEIFRTKSQRNEQMDNCLQAYEDLGTDAAIRPFLYAINYDLVPVNYRHSVNGKTAALIASELNNANHLRLLLFMGADPYIVDIQQQNAISLAASKGNHECIDVLNNYSLHGYVVKNAKPEFVDYDLIIDIMYLLRTKPEFSPGKWE